MRQVIEGVRRYYTSIRDAERARLLAEEAARQAVIESAKAERRAVIDAAVALISPHAYEISLNEMGLSARVLAHLERAGLTNAGEVMERLAEGDEGEPDIDAIMYLVGPASVSPDIVSAVAQFGEEYQIPITTGIIFPDDDWTLTDINVDFYTSGELAAPLADKILKGTAAGTIPVVTPSPYLYINMIAAEKLGLEVPEKLMLLADKIVR